MLRLLKRILILVGLVAIVWFGAHAYAAWRLKAALRDAGLSERVATCMTGRLTRRLSLLQLARLQKLEGDKPTLKSWVRAVAAVDDGKVVLVTVSSAALCRTGLAR
ncbi:hypothetical protein HT136_14930 [Novosphingobium profundi]|uniref:hypothetical protein n=1 Tax=Novosphingobium profundi TaxID=1774954 RepID=UPI001BD91A31|nr:hypothetical protein [Novosphingobium profundi]MBT0669660.1 hypothetical protein [Novosphingobium profundi]